MEEDGRGKKGGEDPAQALPLPQAPPGFLRCTEPFSFHCTVGPPDMAPLCAPGIPPPTLLHFSPFPPSVLSLFVSYPSLSLSLSLAQPISPLTPPPLLLSFPGASLPSRVGQKSRRRALLSRHSHLTQCGTTWLITNPISGALCASKGCSVLLSHFIRAITGHFIFCLRPNVLSDTLNTSGAVRGDSRGS